MQSARTNVRLQGDLEGSRHYAVCVACGEALFPLDEKLGLLPGPWTPSLHERAVRLGTWVPFAAATPFTHTTIAEPTIRRQTEAAGAA